MLSDWMERFMVSTTYDIGSPNMNMGNFCVYILVESVNKLHNIGWESSGLQKVIKISLDSLYSIWNIVIPVKFYIHLWDYPLSDHQFPESKF